MESPTRQPHQSSGRTEPDATPSTKPERTAPARATIRASDNTPMRVVRDATGTWWRIRAISIGDGGECLVFECDDIVRRVRQYPPHWAELGDEELLALSLRW